MRVPSILLFTVCLWLGFPLLAQTTVQAIGGDPFGVCVVRGTAATSGSAFEGLGSAAALEASLLEPLPETAGRALYPVALGSGSTAFLFKGDQPLELTGGLRGPVILDEAARQELLRTWWQAYTHQASQVVQKDLYEPVVETYLTSMLSRRLGLDGSGTSSWRPWKHTSVDEVVGLLLGTESIRLAMQRDRMLDKADVPEAADQPLPAGAAPPELPVPVFDASKVVVEPMAFRVPRECFYLRSERFSDFVWLRGLLDVWGGEFRNLLATRGSDYQLRTKLERQLALRETALSRRFGGFVVEDVALIGTDTFFREGSAVGVIFHAKNTHRLAGHLVELRRQAHQEDPGTVLETVSIGGRECSLLSRADNAVRSFYAAEGDFHLVTNSRWILEAFLKTAQDRNASLGSLAEFQFARSRMPVSRKDPAFLYLSDPFFCNLVGPAYRVEMTRRAQAGAELAVLALARLAAQAEGEGELDLPQLTQEGYLPKGFGLHADGTGLVLRDGQYVDSMRGGRGTFLPVPDVPLDGITASEAAAYRRFAETYAQLWTNTDPVFGAITHRAALLGRERVALELHISPYAKSRYGLLTNFLGQAGAWRLNAIKGDLLSVELVTKAPGETRTEPWELNRLFGGLRDFSISFQIRQGELVPDQSWGRLFETSFRGYLGQYKPFSGGIADFLFRGGGAKPDVQGYYQPRGLGDEDGGTDAKGVWGRRFTDFIVLGLDRKTLEDVTPRMGLRKAERPAQVRLALGDLAGSRMATFLTAQLYTRERRISAGNALLLQNLSRQLRIEPKDALGVAEGLLGERITCPLGGTYGLTPANRWVSSAWREERLGQVETVPEGYRHPGLDWLQGAALEFSIDFTSLRTRLELLVDPRKGPASAHQE